MKLRKWFHRWILDSLLKNPPPLAFLLVCVFGTVFSVGFWCAHWIDEVNLSKYSKLYDVFSDNIGGYSGLNHLRDLLPIDVVYTWVNGSDPLVTDNINKFSTFKVPNCGSYDCIESSYFTVELSNSNEVQLFQNSNLKYIQSFSEQSGNVSKIFALFYKKETEDSQIFYDLISKLRPNSTIAQAFWTKDDKLSWTVAWDGALIIRLDYSRDIYVEVSDVSPNNFDNFNKKCKTKHHFGLALIECSDIVLLQKLKFDFERHQAKSGVNFPKVWKAYLVLHSKYSLNKIDLSRYEDNEELRYSLRSLERYAPWVRKIFLVTNGQIPNWLNLDHPRLTIVTHTQIFPDLSHLPTFSSPAIESHIHRIPGLSDHFLYLNDDILLGDRIHPNDFYSSVSGYKVYLSWFIPDCAEGCPGTWLGDGYCDQSCNTSACFWDGGDCTKPKDQQKAREELFGIEDDGDDFDNFMEGSEFCAPSCSYSWLADTYCDSACNIPSCGFDAGDCGSKPIKENSFKLNLETNAEKMAAFLVPQGELSAWVDTSSLLDRSKNETLEGSYTSSQGLIVTSFNIPLEVIVFVFKSNSSGASDIELRIVNKNKKEIKKVEFRIHYNTILIKLQVGDGPETHSASNNTNIYKTQNYNFDAISPKILSNKTIHEIKRQNYAQIINKDESKILKKKFDNGELTQKGLDILQKVLNDSRTEARLGESHILGKRKILNSERHEENIDNIIPEYDNLADLQTFSHNHPSEIIQAKFSSGRKLLDEFKDSLIYVNHLYNSVYGFQGRKVPAHMPHFINKEIFQELYDKFYREFLLTSSHKTRQANDMQFSFSYFYYILSEKREKDMEEIFDQFDTDLSGTWSDREIRSLLSKLYDLPLQFNYFSEFHKDIKNCSAIVKPNAVSTPPYERYADSDVPTVSKELVVKCANSELWKKLRSLKSVPKFPHKILTDSVVHFKMITSNVSTVVNLLDDVRKNTRKFICFNNNMKADHADNNLVRALLQDTYEALYPVASSFELPMNYRNRFSYTWQLQEWKRWKNLLRSLIYAFLSCLIFLTVTAFFSNEIEGFKKRFIRRRRRKNETLLLAKI